MTKEQAFDLQQAAQAAGVRSQVYTNDRKNSIQYGITLTKIEDLFKVARQLATDEGPMEIALRVDEGRTEIHVL